MQHRVRTLLAAVAATAVAGLVAAAPAADARASRRSVASIDRVIASRHTADDDSLNWAGYYTNAAPNQPISQASTLVVTPEPKVVPPTLSASWVGIGGAQSTDLIQAGVAYGRARGYYAWYEMLPASMVRITSGCSGDASCAVTFGDHIAVNIQFVGNNAWNIAVTNVGKWSWSQTFDYASSMSSVEWIYEAPATTYLGLATAYGVPARFDHANFYGNRYMMGGVPRQLAPGDAVKTNVSPVGFVMLATPSPIRSDSAFAVCPYRQTCPTP
ncbi:MAG: hypothetical protein QOJ00_1359 [Actinomycetota bacterium]